MKNVFLTAISAAILVGCTSVTVNPISQDLLLKEPMREICIINNPAVTVSDFVSVLEKRFNHHGIGSKVIQSRENAASAGCVYTLEYSAKRSWDVVTYLSWAELKLFLNGVQTASAEYRLVGKGGLSPTKWQSTETKMTPVVDKLLGGSAKPSAKLDSVGYNNNF